MSTATPDTGTAAAGTDAAPRRRRRTALAVAAVVSACALGAGGVLWAGSGPSHDGAAPAPGRGAAAQPGAVRPAVPMPAVAVVDAQTGTVPWQRPITMTATGGTLTSVGAIDKTGAPLAGAVGADGSWTSTGVLRPSSTYTLTPQATDANGVAHQLPALVVRTTPPGKAMTVSLFPTEGASVGVGQPVVVRLSTAVKDKPARAALERKLAVTTVPATPGSWRWFSDSEVHYRPETFWAPGTKVTVNADVAGVQVGADTWGSGSRAASFTVADALTGVVDVQAHTMTVSRNGAVVRVMKASMGRPQFPTRNGTFIVLEKNADRVMDSATVELPPGTPPYKTAVKDAVRLTNSGTFTHGAPWSVGSQGRRNVSHGCINLSPVDADWYFNQVRRGDVVTVVNSTAGPVLSDAGSAEWNMTYEQWRQGSALA